MSHKLSIWNDPFWIFDENIHEINDVDPSAVGILDVNPAPTLSSSIFSPQVNVSGSSINTSSQDEPSLPKLESQPSGINWLVCFNIIFKEAIAF